MTRRCYTCSQFYDTFSKELFCSPACKASAVQGDAPLDRPVRQRMCIQCRVMCDNTSLFCGPLCLAEYRAVGRRHREHKRAA